MEQEAQSAAENGDSQSIPSAKASGPDPIEMEPEEHSDVPVFVPRGEETPEANMLPLIGFAAALVCGGIYSLMVFFDREMKAKDAKPTE